MDKTHEVTYLAKETVRGLYGQVRTIKDPDKRKGFAQYVMRSESHSRIVDMLKLAESESGIAVTPDVLDADPWGLHVPNGTLDVCTGQLREHRRLDLLTKVAPVAYDHEALCPIWVAFLARVLRDDAELIHFVQKEEQCLFMLYGSGANGKSTLIQTLSSLLDDYARQTPAACWCYRTLQGISRLVRADR